MFPSNLLQQCWFLAGPTASGKTDLSLILADLINAEIIAMDSMTLYRGMDIGTAKPSKIDQDRVPHHLIDVLNPEEDFSLAQYLAAAESVCREILARGKTPLFVGGTGLYLRGLLRGVFEGPPADWEFRRQMEEQTLRSGPDWLSQALKAVDPISASRLHPNDHRRLIRALEVFHLTGQPLSELQQQNVRDVHDRPRHVYWISPPRDWLYQRIDRRVRMMFEEGLIDEVSKLMHQTPPLSQTARQGLGYKEVIDFLELIAPQSDGQDRDQSNAINPALLEPLIELIQTRSRQFAKRQHTWFRNMDECQELSIQADDSSCSLANQLYQRCKASDR